MVSYGAASNRSGFLSGSLLKSGPDELSHFNPKMTFAATWLQERYYWLMPFLKDLAVVSVRPPPVSRRLLLL